MVLFHHDTELILYLLEPSEPILVDHRSVNVDWHLYFIRDFNIDFPLDFNWTIYVYRLVNEYRFVYYYRISIDRLIYINGFLDNLLNLYFFYYDLRDFILDFYVFRNFYDPLDDSLWTWDVLRHLYFYFDWSLHDHLFNGFFRNQSCLVFHGFFQVFVLNLQFILFCLKFIYNFFMVFAGDISLTHVIILELNFHSLPLALCQLLL